MLARSHKSVLAVNHCQLLGISALTSINSASRTACFNRTQLLSHQSQPSFASAAGGPSKKPPIEGTVAQSSEPDDTTTCKKLFVISSSKSTPELGHANVQPSGSSSDPSSKLPPKPMLKPCAAPAGTSSPVASVGDAKSTWFGFFHNQRIGATLQHAQDRISASLNAVFTPENIAAARRGLTAAWHMGVRVVQSSIYWGGVFLQSREYFYIQYYALLLLENIVHYTRLALATTIRTIQDIMKK